jgi:hypothetical protein
MAARVPAAGEKIQEIAAIRAEGDHRLYPQAF